MVTVAFSLARSQCDLFLHSLTSEFCLSSLPVPSHRQQMVASNVKSRNNSYHSVQVIVMPFGFGLTFAFRRVSHFVNTFSKRHICLSKYLDTHPFEKFKTT